MYSKLSSIEKGKKSAPKFTFAFQNVRNKIREKKFGKTSSRISSGRSSTKYPNIVRDRSLGSQKEIPKSNSRMNYKAQKNANVLLQQVPAVAVSKPNLKKNLNEQFLNNSVEMPTTSIRGHYSNMDIILEHEGKEDNISNFGTPKQPFWGNKSHESFERGQMRKEYSNYETRNPQKFSLPKSKNNKAPSISSAYSSVRF